MWAACARITGCCSYLPTRAERLCRDGRRQVTCRSGGLGPLSLAVGSGRCIWKGRTLESEALMWDMGTWLLICSCICTWVGLGASAPGEGGGTACQGVSCQSLAVTHSHPGAATVSLSPGPGAGTVTCLNNNILRIDCHWSAPEPSRGARSWLLFTSKHGPGSKHRCVFQASVCSVLLPPEEVLVPSDSFSITLHHDVSGEEQVSLVDSQYLPRRHVKLDPPLDLNSNVSSGNCALTWSISPALEPLTSLLSYELAFKKQEETWEQAWYKDRIFGVTWLILEAVELDPGSSYEARLRVQMATPEDEVAEEERFEGLWSRLTPALGKPHGTLVPVFIFFLLTSLAFVLFKLSPRVKKSFYQHVPSPAAFFQPLYSVHNGNFQTWTGAHRAGWSQSQDYVVTPREGSESSVQEAVVMLTYDTGVPWQSLGLEEEEGLGTGLPADVLSAGHMEWRGQPPAYLPQEDWGPVSPPGPAPLPSQGSSCGYCALGCYQACCPSTVPGDTHSSVSILPVAFGISRDQPNLDPQQGDAALDPESYRALTWSVASCLFWGKWTKVFGAHP
ncbi:interleukin-9 receptor isoform X2 [Manis javanica]|uniref:interleukin-9 receptor isoform X2 n=1 Tax=Manis javanica TaxID=9974 RepID=UPI003C6D9387